MLNYILALIFCKITKWPQKSFLLQINPKSSFKYSNHSNLSFWFNFGKLPFWSSKFVKLHFDPYLTKLNQTASHLCQIDHSSKKHSKTAFGSRFCRITQLVLGL